MDIQLIRSAEYQKIVDDIINPYPWRRFKNINSFPFEEKAYYVNDLVNQESVNNFNIIKNIDVLFEINSYVYGILKLNNTDYIVHVDNEFTIKIVGDTESNWPYFLFCLDDDPDKFEVFMKECETKLGIPIKNPDFDGLYAEIEENFLNPLIFNID
jgi:hypothetical protein